MIVFKLAWVYAVILAIIAAHEAGHAIAGSRRGVHIETLGLGLPFGPRWRRTVTWHGRPLELVLSPLLLGAYVSWSALDSRRIAAMPQRDRAAIHNAGIIVNLVLGFVGWGAVAFILHGPAAWPTIAITTGLAVMTVSARRWLSLYLLPALAPVLLVFMGWMVFAAYRAEGLAANGTIVSAGPALAPHAFADAIALIPAVSLGLAIFNLLPLMPLDNARVVDAWLARWLPPFAVGIYRLGGAAVFFVAIVAAFAGDIARLFR